MVEEHRFSFSKEERICSKTLIEQLFTSGKARSMTAFPLRMVYMGTCRQESVPQVRLLISVSKRHFKHAVDRNRVKRQLREAYRLNKHLLLDVLREMPEREIDIALIWSDSRLYDSEVITKRVRDLLQRLGEKESQVFKEVKEVKGVKGVKEVKGVKGVKPIGDDEEVS